MPAQACGLGRVQHPLRLRKVERERLFLPGHERRLVRDPEVEVGEHAGEAARDGAQLVRRLVERHPLQQQSPGRKVLAPAAVEVFRVEARVADVPVPRLAVRDDGVPLPWTACEEVDAIIDHDAHAAVVEDLSVECVEVARALHHLGAQLDADAGFDAVAGHLAHQDSSSEPDGKHGAGRLSG